MDESETGSASLSGRPSGLPERFRRSFEEWSRDCRREVRSTAVHLRPPSIDKGVTSFLWALVFFLYLWLGMLAIGVDGASAFIWSALAGFAIFFFVRILGDDSPRRPQA